MNHSPSWGRSPLAIEPLRDSLRHMLIFQIVPHTGDIPPSSPDRKGVAHMRQTPEVTAVHHASDHSAAALNSEAAPNNSLPGMEPMLAFNTAISFITNTDWQAYFVGAWAMNQMLLNVSTRKFKRSVRLPEGDVPAQARA